MLSFDLPSDHGPSLSALWRATTQVAGPPVAAARCSLQADWIPTLQGCIYQRSMAIRIQPGLYKNIKGPCCCPSQISGSKVKVEKSCCDGVVSEATPRSTYIQTSSCVHLAPLPLTTRPTVCAISQSICGPAVCLCGWAGPFGTCCNGEGTQVYLFPFTSTFLTARDGGTKFECSTHCLSCGEFELEEAPPGGTPQSVEMQR